MDKEDKIFIKALRSKEPDTYEPKDEDDSSEAVKLKWPVEITVEDDE